MPGKPLVVGDELVGVLDEPCKVPAIRPSRGFAKAEKVDREHRSLRSEGVGDRRPDFDQLWQMNSLGSRKSASDEQSGHLRAQRRKDFTNNKVLSIRRAIPRFDNRVFCRDLWRGFPHPFSVAQ